MKRLFAILVLICALPAWAAEVIPPAPEHYFNDYANVTSPETASRLNQQLEDFERQTSSQIVVAVYPKMQSDSSIDDYTVRVARAWKVGQKAKNNGAILFVFIQDHKMFIQVGYGLEGVLPDIICKQIIDNEIAPRFKRGDYDGGLSAGVAAMMAATKGEYKGTGRTVNQRSKGQEAILPIVGLVFFIFVVYIIIRSIGGGGRTGGGGWGNAAG
ncbi:MAG TPA: TPM domain-containing protein, partial [Verrucomicrobiae bacterium]|nr:TPM domain-containing protein [Verrucomicrobiae bacterium]